MKAHQVTPRHISTSSAVIELGWFIIAEQNLHCHISIGSEAEQCRSKFKNNLGHFHTVYDGFSSNPFLNDLWLPLLFFRIFMQRCVFHIHQGLSVAPPWISRDVHRRLFARWCKAWVEEGKQDRKIVTAASVAHDEVYTPLPLLVSITPPLALGQRARWHLCAAHTSQWRVTHPLSCWHQNSLPLPVDIFRFSLSLSLSVWMGFLLIWIWKVLKVALARLCGTCYCIVRKWLLNTQLIYFPLVK